MHSEELAIRKARGVTYDSLSSVEQRAARMLMGTARQTRNLSDVATKIAIAARADWGYPSTYARVTSVSISIEELIQIAIPFIEALSDKPLRGVEASGLERQVIKMEPPEVGALVALARIQKKGASAEYVCKVAWKVGRLRA